MHYQISFKDVVLTDKLRELGCIDNKTFKLKFPSEK